MVVVVVVVVVYNLVAMLLLISMFSPLLHLPDLGLGAVVEMMDICTKLILLLMGRTAMSMALRNLNLMRALPKETKKLTRRNGPRSPRSAARIANATFLL